MCTQTIAHHNLPADSKFITTERIEHRSKGNSVRSVVSYANTKLLTYLFRYAWKALP